MTRPGCEGLPPEIKGGLKNLPCSPFIDIIYIYMYIYNIYDFPSYQPPFSWWIFRVTFDYQRVPLPLGFVPKGAI
jgi:hypothetical protein